MACRRKIYELNNMHSDQYGRIPQLLKKLSFHCDYGYNIEVGENVLLGSNVFVYTAGHSLHHEFRNSEYEYETFITIGDNV